MKQDHFEAAKITAIIAGFLMIASTFLMNNGIDNYMLIYRAIEVQANLATNSTEIANLHNIVANANTQLGAIINESFGFTMAIWIIAFIVIGISIFFLTLGYYAKK